MNKFLYRRWRISGGNLGGVDSLAETIAVMVGEGRQGAVGGSRDGARPFMPGVAGIAIWTSGGGMTRLNGCDQHNRGRRECPVAIWTDVSWFAVPWSIGCGKVAHNQACRPGGCPTLVVSRRCMTHVKGAIAIMLLVEHSR